MTQGYPYTCASVSFAPGCGVGVGSQTSCSQQRAAAHLDEMAAGGKARKPRGRRAPRAGRPPQQRMPSRRPQHPQEPRHVGRCRRQPLWTERPLRHACRHVNRCLTHTGQKQVKPHDCTRAPRTSHLAPRSTLAIVNSCSVPCRGKCMCKLLVCANNREILCCDSASNLLCGTKCITSQSQ